MIMYRYGAAPDAHNAAGSGSAGGSSKYVSVGLRDTDAFSDDDGDGDLNEDGTNLRLFSPNEGIGSGGSNRRDGGGGGGSGGLNRTHRFGERAGLVHDNYVDNDDDDGIRFSDEEGEDAPLCEF
jgi:hypothetical protein